MFWVVFQMVCGEGAGLFLVNGARLTAPEIAAATVTVTATMAASARLRMILERREFLFFTTLLRQKREN